MSKSPHLVAYATPHGYGHAALITAVLKAFAERCPQVRITLVSQVPVEFFQERLSGVSFAYQDRRVAADFGMKMASASHVLIAESAERYLEAHQNWPQHLKDEVLFLKALAPDLVLSSTAYLPLAAAHSLGIPSAALGPFTWLGIAAHFFAEHPRQAEIFAPMQQAYQNASILLATTPAIPHEDSLTQRRTLIGPVGLPCPEPREELRRRLPLAPGEKVALVALGGIPEPLSVLSSWPIRSGWRWLVAAPPQSDLGQSEALFSLSGSGLSVSQAIACADAIITKPGYGTYIEAACAGTPLLYRSRPDWPETVGLGAWLSQYTGVAEINDQDFATGNILKQLEALTSSTSSPLAEPYGNTEAVDHLFGLLS